MIYHYNDISAFEDDGGDDDNDDDVDVDVEVDDFGFLCVSISRLMLNK